MKKFCATILVGMSALTAIAQPTCAISGAFTNRLGLPDQHPFVLISDRDPDFFSGGSFTRMPATVIFPNTNGIWSTNLTYGLYLATNAYLGEGILFRVPFAYQQPCAYTIDQLAVSGTFAQDFAAGSGITFSIFGPTTTISANFTNAIIPYPDATYSTFIHPFGTSGIEWLWQTNDLSASHYIFRNSGSTAWVGGLAANYTAPGFFTSSNHFDSDLEVAGNIYADGVIHLYGGLLSYETSSTHLSDLTGGGLVELDTNRNLTIGLIDGCIRIPAGSALSVVNALTGNDGKLENSNKVLYWVTATKTNLVSDGR